MTKAFKTGINAPAVAVNGTAVSVEGHTHAGGGGAPTDATYVVTSANATLTNERVLTQGSYLTITDNGSSTVTVAVDATSANTVSKVVARDASGNFSAGTITAALTGNASTASALSSAKTITLSGDVTGSVSTDLSTGPTITTAIGTGVIVDADINAAAAIADTKLATISTAGKVANTATTATSANTASAIVARDASGNFTAGTVTAALTGNASTATTLQTSRNINGTAFNGSADITVTAAAGTLTGTTLNSTVTASSLTSFGSSPTIATPALTLSTTTSTTEGRIAWDATNDQIEVGTGTALAEFGALGSTNGAALGTAGPGTSGQSARADHVHPTTGVVPTTRTLTTTAPLRVGGGASADLSADRTLSINNFTGDAGSGGAPGAVPAPAAGDAAAGKFLKADGSWAAPSAGGGGSSYVAQFSKSGTLTTGTGTFRWYNDSGATRTIGAVRASVGTAPTGASLIVDVNASVGGAAPGTIFAASGDRPTIAAGTFTDLGGTKTVSTIANGDYLTVDVDQVGSTVAGADLTVLVWLS